MLLICARLQPDARRQVNRAVLLKLHREVDHGHIDGGHAQGHAGELALDFGESVRAFRLSGIVGPET